MVDSWQSEPWEHLHRLLETDPEQVVSFLDSLPPSETARTLSRLPEHEQARLLEVIGPTRAASLLEHLSDAQATEIIEELPSEHAAAIVEALPSAEKADLLSGLEVDEAEAILQQLEPDVASDTRRLLQYLPDTAGGIMLTEYLSFPDTLTVAHVVADLRAHGDQYSDYAIQYTYIVDEAGHLAGVLRVRDLLLSRGHERIRNLMVPNPLHARVDTPLDDLKQLFDEHAFLGMPVTDEFDKLVGVVRRAAVEEALGERATATYLKLSGLFGEEELRTMPIPQRAVRRLSWLSLNIGLNIVAASVIAFYQDTLAAVIALAVFLPIISDMSGCSGNQAVAVSIRELALGLVKPYEFMRVLFKEGGVGIINGAALGLLLGTVAFLWQGNPFFGLVVGAALFLNTVVSVLMGGLVPLFLKGLRLDPAVASGPILTTVTDMCGFFLVLSLASAMLPRLAG